MSGTRDGARTQPNDAEIRARALLNQMVRTELKRSGDDLTEARPVDHYFYMANEPSSRGLATQLEAAGYELVRVAPSALPGGTDWTIVARRSEGLGPEFDRDTAALELHAKANGGVYDGWESPVTR